MSDQEDLLNKLNEGIKAIRNLDNIDNIDNFNILTDLVSLLQSTDKSLYKDKYILIDLLVSEAKEKIKIFPNDKETDSNILKHFIKIFEEILKNRKPIVPNSIVLDDFNRQPEKIVYKSPSIATYFYAAGLYNLKTLNTLYSQAKPNILGLITGMGLHYSNFNLYNNLSLLALSAHKLLNNEQSPLSLYSRSIIDVLHKAAPRPK
jgi:hypothetical protein